jgi:uncharacterized protein (TIGR02466 family)
MNITNYNLFPCLANYVECDNFSQLQKDLVDWIYKYQTNTDSVFLSNRGGWQSPSDFYVNNSSFQKFYDYLDFHIQETIKFYNANINITNMWININGTGDYNMLHDHPCSDLSGVMWIKIPENSGDLIFHNPHNFTQYKLIESVDPEVAHNTNYYFSFKFTPKEGYMAIFPSNLMHVVERNLSNEDRISISFNLSIR